MAYHATLKAEQLGLLVVAMTAITPDVGQSDGCTSNWPKPLPEKDPTDRPLSPR